MLRVLFFLILVFLLGLGFAWLAERPGDLLITFGGYEYRVTLMVAAVAVTALVAGVMILWWLLKSLWNSPHAVSRYFRVRRRDRGYQALSTGLLAAGAGDADAARRMHRQTAKLLSAGQEPLVHLLDAQASLLDGDHDAARRKFEAMVDDPETRLLGLRGLYLDAHRAGDRGVARHYAERANSAAPQLGWAAEATVEGLMQDGDWDGALRILDARRASSQVDRATANRQRAVLLTAKAVSILNTDTLAAKNAALEANRLDPTLVPAAVVAAKALFRSDDLKKGSRILEAAWKNDTHPEIADAYVHARPGDSVEDRLRRAQRLADLRPNTVESLLAIARAALEAGNHDRAREAAEAAARLEPREGVFLLLADIAEADGANQGRVREYLSRAVRARPDPAWTADGQVAERWAPFSPVTGRIGAFEWRAPMERVGRLIEQKPQVVAAAERSVAIAPPARPPSDIVDVEPTATPTRAPISPAGAPASAPSPAGETAVPRQPVADRPVAPVAATMPAVPAVPDASAAPSPALATTIVADTAVPIPDDPGVDPSDVQPAGGRFRLF